MTILLSKILTFLLVLQFLFASTGVAVYHHYCKASTKSHHQLLFKDNCCNQVSKSQKVTEAKSCCQLPVSDQSEKEEGCCSNSNQAKKAPETKSYCQLPVSDQSEKEKGCCSHSSEFLQLEFDSPAQQFVSFDLSADLILIFNIADYLPQVKSAKLISFYSDTSPPPNIKKRFQRFQNFRL